MRLPKQNTHLGLLSSVLEHAWRYSGMADPSFLRNCSQHAPADPKDSSLPRRSLVEAQVSYL